MPVEVNDTGKEFLGISKRLQDLKDRRVDLERDFNNLYSILGSVDESALRRGTLTGDQFLDAAILIASRRLFDGDFPLQRVSEIYDHINKERERIESARGLFVYSNEFIGTYFPNVLFGRFMNPQVRVDFTDRSQFVIRDLYLVPKILVTGYQPIALFEDRDVEDSPENREFEITERFRPRFSSKIITDLLNHSGAYRLQGVHTEDQLEIYLATLQAYSDKVGDHYDKEKSKRIHAELSKRIERLTVKS